MYAKFSRPRGVGSRAGSGRILCRPRARAARRTAASWKAGARPEAPTASFRPARHATFASRLDRPLSDRFPPGTPATPADPLPREDAFEERLPPREAARREIHAREPRAGEARRPERRRSLAFKRTPPACQRLALRCPSKRTFPACQRRKNEPGRSSAQVRALAQRPRLRRPLRLRHDVPAAASHFREKKKRRSKTPSLGTTSTARCR